MYLPNPRRVVLATAALCALVLSGCDPTPSDMCESDIHPAGEMRTQCAELRASDAARRDPVVRASGVASRIAAARHVRARRYVVASFTAAAKRRAVR